MYQTLVWGIFSITKGPLKPNLLPNLKYFQIILEDLGLFSSFWKLISPRKKWETWEKFEIETLGFGKKKSALIRILIIPRMFVDFFWILLRVVLLQVARTDTDKTESGAWSLKSSPLGGLGDQKKFDKNHATIKNWKGTENWEHFGLGSFKPPMVAQWMTRASKIAQSHSI